MIDERQPTAPIGHNALDMKPGAIDDMDEVLEIFRDRRDGILKSAANAKVVDHDTAGAAADLIRNANIIWDKIDAERKLRTDPHREVAEAIKSRADRFWADVFVAVEHVKDLVNAWDDAERKRIADQKREQQAALPGMGSIGQEAPPPLPKAASRPIRGDYGGKVTRVEERTYRIDNVRELPEWVLESDPVMKAIESVLRQGGKHHKKIPGVTIGTGATNRIG